MKCVGDGLLLLVMRIRGEKNSKNPATQFWIENPREGCHLPLCGARSPAPELKHLPDLQSDLQREEEACVHL